MDGCDGHDGGHDGLDGLGIGHMDISGLCGFDSPGWDGIDTIDLLEGGARKVQVDEDVHLEPKDGVFVTDEGKLFAVRVTRHGEADVRSIVFAAAERVGLMKVAPILVGQTSLDVTAYKILPVNAWTGATKGDMPSGYRPGTMGRTVMFRHFFQIPKREWGAFSTPIKDKEAGVYVDIAAMTWTMNDRSQTQIFVRVVPMTTLDARNGLWCHRTTKVDAHRKVAEALSRSVHLSISYHAPTVVAHKPATRPVAPRAEQVVAKPRLGGVDLWSALMASPRLAAVHATVPGIPSGEPSGPYTGPVLESEMVTVKVALPRRQTATV
jgi:hypothetical protein